jgi:hypothetical protein
MPKHPYDGLIVKGSKTPDAPDSRDNIKVTFSEAIVEQYIPVWNTVEAPKGIKMLALIMAQKEGFIDLPGTKNDSRSYKFNNPGNIGNTDSGANKGFTTLKAGIEKQISFLTDIANGKNKAYPLGKVWKKASYYSQEIADNQKTYQLEPYCPGYEFIYTGRLDQFIKIYSTGARQKNTYLSLIRSYFKNMGYYITDATTLAEILNIK